MLDPGTSDTVTTLSMKNALGYVLFLFLSPHESSEKVEVAEQDPPTEFVVEIAFPQLD